MQNHSVKVNYPKKKQHNIWSSAQVPTRLLLSLCKRLKSIKLLFCGFFFCWNALGAPGEFFVVFFLFLKFYDVIVGKVNFWENFWIVWISKVRLRAVSWQSYGTIFATLVITKSVTVTSNRRQQGVTITFIPRLSILTNTWCHRVT